MPVNVVSAASRWPGCTRPASADSGLGPARHTRAPKSNVSMGPATGFRFAFPPVVASAPSDFGVVGSHVADQPHLANSCGSLVLPALRPRGNFAAKTKEAPPVTVTPL